MYNYNSSIILKCLSGKYYIHMMKVAPANGVPVVRHINMPYIIAMCQYLKLNIFGHLIVRTVEYRHVLVVLNMKILFHLNVSNVIKNKFISCYLLNVFKD